jgi:hypothetical protein
MSTVFTETAIKQAVLEQIKAAIKDNTIPDSWLNETLTATLGIKKEKVKRVPLTKAQLIDTITEKINSLLGAMDATDTIKEIKEFIKNGGNDMLTATIQATPTSRFVDEPTQQDVKDNIERMLALLNLTQTWDVLAKCNKFSYVDYRKAQSQKVMKKAEKKNTTTPAKKSNYITCTNEEAVQILEPYYTQLASGTISTPECFKASSNPTQSFQRFVFSHMNQAECDITNSINESVYTAWKDANKEVTVTPEELERKQAIIDAFKTANPDYMETLKGWSNRPYIKCLLKKDEVKQVEA